MLLSKQKDILTRATTCFTFPKSAGAVPNKFIADSTEDRLNQNKCRYQKADFPSFSLVQLGVVVQ